MGADEKATAVAAVGSCPRLKREDCRRTKHDSVFSYWKILIGPFDWKDHSQGKEEAERYRTQNLPNCASCTGVYELGIVVSHHRPGRESAKLNPNSIIPVYLGKSDNVRNRLQQYGRDGTHLENGSCKLGEENHVVSQSGPGLFSEIFSKGFSIVYRWAPMRTSKDSEKTEADLLGTFDYAWNKGSNGPRRPEDILKKIDHSSKASQFLASYHLFPRKAKGIKIKIFEPPLLHNGGNFYSELLSNSIFHKILKFGRSQPRLLPWRSSINEDPSVCGVALGHGIICRRIPAEGRKRCEEHKGMKVNVVTPKLITDGKFAIAVDSDLTNRQSSPPCGVIKDDGTPCAKEPVKGNKRCLEHKGQRIPDSISNSVRNGKEHYGQGPSLDKNLNLKMSPCFPDRLIPSPCENGGIRDWNTICGMVLENGTFCTRQPPGGRKRCEEHKGMRIKKTNPKSFIEQIPTVLGSSGAECWREASQRVLPSVVFDRHTPTCGATLQNGSFCRRKPSEGNNRCWQHLGTRATSSKRNSFGNSDYRVSSSFYVEDPSTTCGAPLRNGSYCRRRTKNGRCWQH